jgi:hypothetical protein
MSSFNFNASQNSGQGDSTSRHGLFGGDVNTLSSFLQPAAMGQFAPYLQQQLATPFDMPRLNQYGVYDSQQQGVNNLLKQSVGNASAGLAKRGFLNPNATTLAAQTGVQSFLPQYLQQVGTNIQNQEVVPEQVRQQRMSDTLNAFQQLIALLGGASSSTTTGTQGSSNGGITNIGGLLSNVGGLLGGGSSLAGLLGGGGAGAAGAAGGSAFSDLLMAGLLA